MKRLIALALGLAALPALAQTAPAPVKPDAGYFRPSDLAAPTPPFVVTDPAPAKPVDFGPLPPGPDPVEEIRRAEEARLVERQMDRIERENERARREAPTPITGAFTGLTDERDR